MNHQEVKIHISATHAQLAADMQKARQAVETNSRGIQRALEGIRGKFGGAMASVKLMAAAAAAGVATGLAMVIRQAIETADNMGKMAQSIGVPVESLSTLAYAAKLSGVEIDKLQTTLGRLSRNMLDAAKGTGEAKDAFAALGINIQDSDGKLIATEDVLKQLADKFKGMEDGATKTALAMQTLGKSGADLVPWLNLGSEGIEKLQQRARELGLEIDTNTAKQAEIFNDSLTELKAGVSGLGMDIAQVLVPWLNRTVGEMRDANKEAGFLLATWVGLKSLAKSSFDPNAFDTLEEKIANVRSILQKYYDEQEKGITGKFRRDDVAREVRRFEARLAQLEAEKKAEQEAFNARREQATAEAQMKSEATEAIQRQLTLLREREAAEKKAMAEAQSRQKRGETAILDLERQIAMTGELTELEKVRWEIEKGKFADLDPKHKAKIEALAKEKDHIQAAIEAEAASRANVESIERQIQALEQQVIFFGMSTSQITLYKLALEGATPSQLEMAAALLETIDANAALKDATKETTTEIKDQFADLKQAIEGFGKDSAAAIVDFALTGKQSFGDMVQSMIADMLKMLVYQQIMQPIFGAIGNGVSGAIGTILPSGGRATGGPVSAGKMYEVNERGVPELLNVGNRQFLMMADQSGHVTPAGSGSSGGGYGGGGTGEVTVNIINKNGSEVSTQQKESPQGIEIDVMIDQTLAKKLGQFGSKSNKTLKSTYGARERLVSR